MKKILIIAVISLTVSLAFLPVINTDVLAQTMSTTGSRPEGRAGTWEFSLPFTYNPSSSWGGPGGSGVELDDAWGFGFGAGYNFSDNFQLNGLFSWSGRDYTAHVINDDLTRRDYNNTLDTSTVSLNGLFYFSKGKISPFVSGGVGVTFLDTNIQTSPGSTACWWDPWYGYVCSSTASTKTETDMSYNAGVGARIDLSPQFSLQPSYNKMWIDIESASSMPDFDVWRLDLIFRMP